MKGANGDKERWYSFSFGSVQSHFKHAPTTTVTIRDITKHKRTEESLRASREQLREFAARLDGVREEERMRVAREIHDELGQALTILKMDLAWIMSKPQNRTHKKIKSMIAEVDQTIQKVRQIVTELRPSILDELGLSAAIECLHQDDRGVHVADLSISTENRHPRHLRIIKRNVESLS